MDRLHRVLDIDETAAGFRGGGGSSSSTAGRFRSSEGPGDAGADSEGRSLERACLRAERGGPSEWIQLLPRLTAHVDQNPRDAQAWALLARARAAQPNEKEALRAAAEATRLDPNVHLGHSLSVLVARSSFESGRLDAASRAAESALASQPGDLKALELLVRALAARGLLDKSEATLAVVAQSHGSARAAALAWRVADDKSREPLERHRWLSTAASLGRGTERPLRELGEVCLVLQRDQEALQWLLKAFSQPGGNSDVDVAHTLSKLYTRAGRVEEALDVYRSSLAAVPDNLSLSRSYGQLLLKQGRASEAIQVIQRTARLSAAPDAAALHITLAELHQGLGQMREALEAWESAASLDGNNAAAWKGLVAAASALGDSTTQLRALTKLSMLEPGVADWPAQHAALLLREDPGSREAEIHLERALRLNPSHVDALVGLGRLRSGREALDLFERALRASPKCVEALEGAGAVRWARGERKEAAECYKALLEARPNDSAACFRLAFAALAEQNNGEARSLLLRVLQGDRPTQEAHALMGFLHLLLGSAERARESLQLARRAAAPEEPQGATRAYWALCLAEGGDLEQAHGEFKLAAQQLEALRRLRDDAGKQEALRRGSLEDAGVADLLPGAGPRICRLLESFLRPPAARPPPSAAAVPATAPARPPPSASVAAAAPASAAPAAAAPAVGAATAGGGEGTWRDAMYDGQPIEVYSKSAGTWLPGLVAQLNADMVKVKYLIDGQWCEKKLLRSSDSLRPAPANGGAQVAAFSPPARPTSQGGSPTDSPSAAPGCGSPARRETSAQADPPSTAAGRVGAGAGAPGSGHPALKPGPTPAPQDPAPRRWTADDAARREDAATKAIDSARNAAKAEEARLREQLLDTSKLIFGQVLGSGAFGAVYRGHYQGDEVAIKKLHIADGQVTAVQIQEFRKEVENLQALRHPRLVCFIGAALIESGGTAGAPRNPPSLCIVTEFMPNGTLHALLHTRNEPLSFAQRLAMAIQVSEGVVFLHGQSPPFVHRDLKSLNAVLDYELNVKLCDFGLTQSMEKTHISRRDNEGGSPRYMAPELFDARGKITEKVDVWALGCMAVEILSGRLPHEECNSIQQVMTKTLVQKHLPFVDWTGISEDLKVLAELSFEFRPVERIDAARFLEGLRGLES